MSRFSLLAQSNENWLTASCSACSTAFTHPQYGHILLQLSMSLCESLSRFTMRLNRRPDLTRRLRARDEESGGKTVAETSAEIIQKFFSTCLMDRSAGRKPEGKKVGVYMFANLTLKLLFAVCSPLHLLLVETGDSVLTRRCSVGKRTWRP